MLTSECFASVGGISLLISYGFMVAMVAAHYPTYIVPVWLACWMGASILSLLGGILYELFTDPF